MAFENFEVWFVTGAQLLYGGDAVVAVDAHSNEMVKGLSGRGLRGGPGIRKFAGESSI